MLDRLFRDKLFVVRLLKIRLFVDRPDRSLVDKLLAGEFSKLSAGRLAVVCLFSPNRSEIESLNSEVTAE